MARLDLCRSFVFKPLSNQLQRSSLSFERRR